MAAGRRYSAKPERVNQGMRRVSIIGVGCTAFGHRPESLKDLAVAACNEAIADAGVDRRRIEAFYLGNFGSGMLARQELTASIVANQLALPPIPVTKVEGACASGGIALRHGWLMVATGQADIVLVAGAEKMTSAPTEVVTEALAAATDVEAGEGKAGLTFPGFFAMVAARHMHEFGTTEEQLALVALKNRMNAQQNPRAQFYGKPADLEKIRSSRLIADPLRLFDCSPISDGAAAAVLCASELALEFTDQPIEILASVQSMGPATLGDMPSLETIPATVRAAEKAYQMAGITPQDVDVAEVHDCFTIAEIVAIEDLGFVAKGEGGPAVESGLTSMTGTIPVNPSGGLLSKGHPVGATGMAQCFEIVRQLRGQAENQVPDARIGLLQNLGGTGGTVTVTILGQRGVV